MTETAIKITSLRELDALVAERVMGWAPASFRRGGDFWIRGVPLGSEPAIPIGQWSPTTDWNAMREVMEKVPQIAEFTRSLDSDGEWCVAEGTYGGWKVITHHADLTVAICLAALRINGVNVELEL